MARRYNAVIEYFLHLKNHTLVLLKTTLQTDIFTLKCERIKRKCVRMIQPVGALSPRAVSRGSNGAYGKKSLSGNSNSNIALINAGGVALAAGGLTTAIARSYTPNWGYAGVLGLFGAFLSLFFMTPQLIESANKNNAEHKSGSDVLVKSETAKTAEAMRGKLKPAKKMVQFRQITS